MPKPTDHDSYIRAAADFAVPILEKLRSTVHKACPGVEETIKWSSPYFDHHGVMVGMAAFKAHVTLSFWRGKQLSDPEGLLDVVGKTQMGSLRIESMRDLPTQKVLVAYFKEAMALNEAAAAAPKVPAKQRAAAREAIVAPDDLLAALEQVPAALATYSGFAWSRQKEYVEWVTEAKREATRQKRIAQAVEWLAAGKPRNWRYMPGWE